MEKKEINKQYGYEYMTDNQVIMEALYAMLGGWDRNTPVEILAKTAALNDELRKRASEDRMHVPLKVRLTCGACGGQHETGSPCGSIVFGGLSTSEVEGTT